MTAKPSLLSSESKKNEFGTTEKYSSQHILEQYVNFSNVYQKLRGIHI